MISCSYGPLRNVIITFLFQLYKVLLHPLILIHRQTSIEKLVPRLTKHRNYQANEQLVPAGESGYDITRLLCPIKACNIFQFI